jgi:hypothetical protein
MHCICPVLDYLSTLPWAESVYETTSSFNGREQNRSPMTKNQEDNLSVARHSSEIRAASAYRVRAAFVGLFHDGVEERASSR